MFSRLRETAPKTLTSGAIAVSLLFLSERVDAQPSALNPKPKNSATATPAPAGMRLGRVAVDDRDVVAGLDSLRAMLAERTGVEVHLTSYESYRSLAEAIKQKNVDVAFLGPITYVLSKELVKIEPLASVKRSGSPFYQSVIVVGGASRIRELADLRGRRLAFVDPQSMSGYLVPKALLLRKRVDEYSEEFLGSHEAVARAVEDASAEGGGLSKIVYRWLVQRKRIDPSKVVVLTESSPYPEYVWVVRSDLDTEIKRKMRHMLVSLRDERILGGFRAEGFSSIQDKDYDGVRLVVQALPKVVADVYSQVSPKP